MVWCRVRVPLLPVLIAILVIPFISVSAAAQTTSATTGASSGTTAGLVTFNRPLSVVPPRLARIGVKLNF